MLTVDNNNVLALINDLKEVNDADISPLVNWFNTCDINTEKTYVPWYDDFRAKNGLLLFGRDFGNLNSIIKQRALREETKNTRWEPPYSGEGCDRSYYNINKFLNDSGLSESTYLTNYVPFARPGSSEETDTYDNEEQVSILSRPFVEKQIKFVQPKVIGGLGKESYNWLCQQFKLSTIAEGKWTDLISNNDEEFKYQDISLSGHTIKLVPVPHPSRPCPSNWPAEKTVGYYKKIKALLSNS